MQDISKTYQPKNVEAEAIATWAKGNHFHCEPSQNKDSYTIVIPPPNVTAALHLGHALNNTLQDILIRFRRMQGYNTLWMPGTDHAGIATQTVVEKRILAEQGKRRTDFTREEFIDKIKSWKDTYETQILGQLKAMGCSCDWQRTRFTMDEVCAKAVRANFMKLFRDGLIYRGKRLVNWDPATQTVLADDEVEHEIVHGHFWYMSYPLTKPVEINGEIVEHVTVATTRPETMLGDTAIAMNPSDKRAKYLVGKTVRLPIVGRIIPIVSDEHVVLPNPESDDDKAKFSTGFLKVTPAHDPDDWQIGLRHNLDVINIMAPDGSISDKYGWEDCDCPEAQNLLGLDRFEARKAIVEWFKLEKLLADVKDYAHPVGHSYRSHVPIEPYLSDQWYIAVKKPIESLAEKFGTGLIDNTDVPLNSLAGLALKPLLDKKIKFTPDRYSKTYQNWLENLRDWPISRQLWWGHQIPIWSKEGEKSQLQTYLSSVAADKDTYFINKTEDGYVAYICIGQDDEALIEKLNNDGFTQDPDVLDTWFSSALWPFSTLGWPDETAEMKSFYPGNVLCTAREIITLWVSRMVMMGQYCVGDIPFSDIYIHAMIQDGQGRKMSKSLGNGIDPLIIIDSHGADAMRFTIATMITDTQDIRMPIETIKLPDGREINSSLKFDIGRNFCNKLWNGCRFVMMNLEDIDPSQFDKTKLKTIDKWILSKLARTISNVTGSLDNFKYSEPLNDIYKFFWNDFCDWYVEWAKPRLQDETDKATVQSVLAFVLDQTLRLLHPFVPFVTESMFAKLNEIVSSRSLQGLAEATSSNALVIANWPGDISHLIDSDIEEEIIDIQTAIKAIRDIRSKYNIAPSEKKIASATGTGHVIATLTNNSQLITYLANLSELIIEKNVKTPENAATAICGHMQIFLHDAINVQQELARLEKQKIQIEKGKSTVEAKLNNENFTNRAKPEVVAGAREKLDELTQQLKIIAEHINQLKS